MLRLQAPPTSDHAGLVRIHLLIPTHTTRHLGTCLAAIACQTRPPDSVVVSCDTDDAAIGGVLDGMWTRVCAALRGRGAGPVPRLVHAYRPFQGRARPSQARNNGLRALDAEVHPGDGDLVVGIDGDMILDPAVLARHGADAARGAEVIIAFRTCLDEGTTGRVSAEMLLLCGEAGIWEKLGSPQDRAALADRQRRYERQLHIRSLLPRQLWRALVKPHKPKLISAHYAATVGRLRAVNGFDEEYEGYGYEDDDLGRRLLAVVPPSRVSIAVDRAPAYHLWHPSRAPSRPTDAPGYTRFARADLPTYAMHGWKNPADQPTPTVRVVPDSPS